MKNRCFSFMRSGSLFRVYGGRLTGFWCVLVLLLWGAVLAVNSASLLASATPQISCGNRHSLSLKSDGTVWAWGYNGNGQLGDGTTTDRSTPVQVNRLGGIIAVAVPCGGSHGLAVEFDGTVWAWGYNWGGQLGDGTSDYRSTPVQVSSLSGVIAVAAGTDHSLAVKSDGTVWAWGDMGRGGLGTYRKTPVQVSGLSGVTAVAGGYSYNLAVKSDGTVWAWGENTYGQLGDGTTDYRSTPVQVSSLSGVIAVACGSSHSLAVKSDGTVWAWGNNEAGRLGDGTTTNRATPVQVSSLSGVIAVTAGSYHSLALKSDGTVWAWGSNGYEQLGNSGITYSSYSPVQVDSLSDVIAVAGGSTHSLAMKSDGSVWAWGYNGNGQLGDGTTTDRSTPVQVSSINLYDASPTPTPIPTSASAQLPDAGVAPVQYDPTTKRFARLLTDEGGVYFGYRDSSGEWGNEFVCTYYGGDAQLLFDSEGVPHVFVNSEDSEYEREVLQLIHWRKAATVWKLVEEIDLPSSMYGATVVRFGNGNDIHALSSSGHYGTNASGTWAWEDSGTGGDFEPFTFGFYGLHDGLNTMDLAIDSHNYAHVIGGDTYATNKSGSWTTQVVDKRFDNSQYSGDGNYEGLGASTMAVSPITQQPAVVIWGNTYVETGSIKTSYLTYYTPRADGQKWRKQTIPADVDGYVGPDGRRGSGGAGARLQFDEDGLPHVVFCDMATGHNPHQYSVVGQIRHAVRGEGGEWSVKTVYRQTDHTKEGMLNVAMAVGDSAILFAGNRVKKVNSKRKVRPVFVRKKINELFIKE